MIKRPDYCFRVLHNRGVDGIFIPPLPGKMGQCHLANIAGWNRFSVVTTTYAIDAPAFRRVVPDHFRNIKRICEIMAKRGYERIGLVIPQSLDERVFNHYSGGYAAFHFAAKRAMLRPFLFNEMEDRVPHLLTWVREERPDALILSNRETALEVLAELRQGNENVLPIGVVARFDDFTAGIDELPSKIGVIAAEVLGDMIYRNEKYDQCIPIVTMVPGNWEDGRLMRLAPEKKG